MFDFCSVVVVLQSDSLGILLLLFRSSFLSQACLFLLKVTRLFSLFFTEGHVHVAPAGRKRRHR